MDLLINYSSDIDYNFYNNYLNGTILLLGVEYAPLRKEFQNHEISFDGSISRILLTTGNMDKDNITLSILEELTPALIDRDIIVDVVMGRMFQNKELVHELYDSNPKVCLHENVSKMSDLIKNCDLSISANGTTVYELAAIGTPIISFAMVREQLKSAEAMNKLGIVDYCGESYSDKSECVRKITERVCHYITHYNELIELADKSHRLIDGNGCKRIVEALISLRHEGNRAES